MPIKSVVWGERTEAATVLTIGEFSQGADYRVCRPQGSGNWLLIVTLDGQGRVWAADGTMTDIGVGEVLLWETGAYQEYGSAPATGSWSLAWSHFVPPAGWDYGADWPLLWPGLRRIAVGPRVTGRVHEALRVIHEIDVGEGELAGRFLRNALERAFLHLRQATTPRAPRDERINRALHVIRQRLGQPLDVPTLASACGLSPSRLAHLFRDEMGETPQRYIEARRLEMARRLLRFTGLPVAEVARSCGFEDPFYFSRRFRQHQGVSPRTYREQPSSASPA